MNPTRLENLLKAVAAGSTTAQDAIDELKSLPFQEMNIAKPDLHRSLRQGASEAIFCQGKTADQVVAIARELLAAEQSVLATRCDTAHREALERHFVNMKYNELGRVASIGARALFEAGPLDDLVVLVITAGTADLPVAEESAAVLEHFGFSVKRVYDVGVAGLHRLLAQVKTLRSADAIIVAAGMDGALPSVIGGIVSCPVIAVPTSVGYGASFEGLAALLTMLNSCAHGITVVNIDNGFGAAMALIRNLVRWNERSSIGAGSH